MNKIKSDARQIEARREEVAALHMRQAGLRLKSEGLAQELRVPMLSR